MNIGSEENGKGEEFNRPILILKKYSRKVFIGIPLTRTVKNHHFYYPVTIKGKVRSCLITKIRLFDSKRLTQKIFTINEENFQNIRKAVKDIL